MQDATLIPYNISNSGSKFCFILKFLSFKKVQWKSSSEKKLEMSPRKFNSALVFFVVVQWHKYHFFISPTLSTTLYKVVLPFFPRHFCFPIFFHLCEMKKSKTEMFWVKCL